MTSHRRPDGDGTGSMAGLASLLRARGKTAVIYSLDPIARRYQNLPDTGDQFGNDGVLHADSLEIRNRDYA